MAHELHFTRRALLASAFVATLDGAATRVNEAQPQRRGAPLVIQDAQLACWRARQLELWDLRTRRLALRLPLPEPEAALGVAANAILVAACDISRPAARLLRCAAFQCEEFPVEAPYYFAGADRLVAAGAGEFWVSETPRGPSRYRLEKPVRKLESLEWRVAQHLTFTAAEPGSALFYESGYIVLLRANGERERFAVDGECANPLHLAAGPRPGTVWATDSGRLYLLALDHGEARVRLRIPADGAVSHLAAAGERAALLSVTLQAGAAHSATLAVFDTRGTRPWQATVPGPRTDAWVAASREHVAVLLDGSLQVFTAGGASILVSRSA